MRLGLRGLKQPRDVGLRGRIDAEPDDGHLVQHGIAESFFATLKKELMYRHVWPTRRPLVQPSSRSLQGSYNRVRLHSTLNYSSPHLYEEDYYRLTAAT